MRYLSRASKRSWCKYRTTTLLLFTGWAPGRLATAILLPVELGSVAFSFEDPFVSLEVPVLPGVASRPFPRPCFHRESNRLDCSFWIQGTNEKRWSLQNNQVCWCVQLLSALSIIVVLQTSMCMLTMNTCGCCVLLPKGGKWKLVEKCRFTANEWQLTSSGL